jgi:carbonic anhydrase
MAVVAFYLSSGCEQPQREYEHAYQYNHADDCAHGRELHWGYVAGPDTVPPEQWGTLSEPAGSRTCRTGKEQSPIALTSMAAPSMGHTALSVAWRAAPIIIVNNGHTITYELGDAGTLRYVDAKTGQETTDTIVQFHFHSPSEHTLDGVRYPIEIHFVHVDAMGKPTAAVGVFVREGAAAAELDSSFRLWPAMDTQGIPVTVAGTINPAKLLPVNQSALIYPGSLTTPPCNEGLTWYVMRTPVEWSAAQIAAFRQIPNMHPSDRPLQPVGARTVRADNP